MKNILIGLVALFSVSAFANTFEVIGVAKNQLEVSKQIIDSEGEVTSIEMEGCKIELLHKSNSSSNGWVLNNGHATVKIIRQIDKTIQFNGKFVDDFSFSAPCGLQQVSIKH